MTTRILVMTRTQPGPSEETRPTGTVAEAVVFSDGTAVLHWLTKPGSTEVYESEKDLRKIREFSGRSHFSEAPVPSEALAGLQDHATRIIRRETGRPGWRGTATDICGLIAQARQLGACEVGAGIDRLLADLRSTDFTPDAFLEALTQLVAGTLPQPARQETVTS